MGLNSFGRAFQWNTIHLPPPQTKYEGALHSCLYNLHSKHFCGFQHSSSYPLYLLKELLQVIII